MTGGAVRQPAADRESAAGHEQQRAAPADPSAGLATTRRSLTAVWLLSAVLVAAGGGLLLGPIGRVDVIAAPFRIPWWSLVVLTCGAELNVVHVQYRRESHSISLREFPLALGFFFATPATVVLALLAGSALALLYRRLRPVKLVFNLGQFLLLDCLAVLLFHRLVDPGDLPGPSSWAAALLALVLTHLAGTLLVLLVIAITEQRFRVDKLPGSVRSAAVVSMGNFSLALLVVLIAWHEPLAVWLLPIPVVILLLAYRAYVAQHEEHANLQLVYDFTRKLHAARTTETALIAALAEVRDSLQAEIAQIVLLPSEDDGGALRSTMGPGDRLELMAPAHTDPLERIWASVASTGRARLLPRPIAQVDLGRDVARQGVRDAVVVPLLGETRAFGALLVANRLGDVGTFDGDDLRLLETLAAHAGIALENGRLEQSLERLSELQAQLTHQAFHDPLTGLANRALFTDRVEHALRGRREGDQAVAVLFIDLDDFKRINDTLGHAAGDHVLATVADRLRACLRRIDTPARFGGDEFAVLLEALERPEDATATAARILEALARPSVIDGAQVSTSASVGLAVTTVAGEDAGTLLRRADLAMYRAKNQGKGRVSALEPDTPRPSEPRLGLERDLERAVERGEFVVHYQPVVDLVSRRPVLFEALVRWRHPERGLLFPSEFIALAELTGAIHAIGRHLLADACGRAKDWADAFPDGPAISVSVNTSPVQLENPGFPGDVATALGASGLEGSSLVLELTETVMMGEGHAMLERLADLRALGVRLALDDFGTGYSSLAYLQRFPVDILKVPKAFTNAIGTDEASSALAGALVSLGASLSLETIVEGIETEEQVDALRLLGCRLGQGFVFARPMPADAVPTFLIAHAPPPGPALDRR